MTSRAAGQAAGAGAPARRVRRPQPNGLFSNASRLVVLRDDEDMQPTEAPAGCGEQRLPTEPRTAGQLMGEPEPVPGQQLTAAPENSIEVPSPPPRIIQLPANTDEHGNEHAKQQRRVNLERMHEQLVSTFEEHSYLHTHAGQRTDAPLHAHDIPAEVPSFFAEAFPGADAREPHDLGRAPERTLPPVEVHAPLDKGKAPIRGESTQSDPSSSPQDTPGAESCSSDADSSLRSLSPETVHWRTSPVPKPAEGAFARSARIRGWHKIGGRTSGWVVYDVVVTTLTVCTASGQAALISRGASS